MTRTWRMFAGRVAKPVSGREFLNFGPDHYVRMYGHTPVPVELTENPDGAYYGWIHADRPQERFASKHTGGPVMIQPSYSMFAVQFPYGPEDGAEAGDGEIVRMTCRAVES